MLRPRTGCARHSAQIFSLVGAVPRAGRLSDTNGLATASKYVSSDKVAQRITCGPSAGRHLEAIRSFIGAGYDHIILVQVGLDQEYVLKLFQHELAPALRQEVAQLQQLEGTRA